MAETQLTEYLDMHTLVERHPQFKEGQMRWLVVKKDENGLAFAIKRIGRRLYFHVPSLLKWIDSQKA